ncbi:MAG: hypothetical protein IKQ46_13320 [Bacteroidales bacterium]|jgi:hypothetical protein|nr:hypothetical protein [Bacteroidales bacterium]
MKKILSILLVSLVPLANYAQSYEIGEQNNYRQTYNDDEGEVTTFGEEVEVEPQKDFLGFMLLPGSNDLVRFYEIHINRDGTYKYTQLTMDSFVNKATGRERSLANPDKCNFFVNFGIKNPGIVSQLWKLRYKEYPYSSPTGIDSTRLGWANNPDCDLMPSEQQFAILKNFGIEKVSSMCYGDQAFTLLKLMEQSEWIEKYKGAAGQTTAVSTGGTNYQGETFID